MVNFTWTKLRVVGRLESGAVNVSVNVTDQTFVSQNCPDKPDQVGCLDSLNIPVL